MSATATPRCLPVVLGLVAAMNAYAEDENRNASAYHKQQAATIDKINDFLTSAIVGTTGDEESKRSEAMTALKSLEGGVSTFNVYSMLTVFANKAFDKLDDEGKALLAIAHLTLSNKLSIERNNPLAQLMEAIG